MPSLPVVIPLIIAAFLAGGAAVLGRRALDLIGIATSAVVLVINIHLVLASAAAPIVYWFGGWQPDPRSHFPLGICFTIDPLGAGLAALVSLLVLAAFTFSWSYFNTVRSLYHALLLVFLASMCGLCLTGDLFNLFVWFELMSCCGRGPLRLRIRRKPAAPGRVKLRYHQYHRRLFHVSGPGLCLCLYGRAEHG